MQSFASEPLDNFETYIYEIPGEGTAMISGEISYQPATPVEGYHGAGFAETDHRTAPAPVTIDVPADGLYSVTVVYANGNGPVNTENKCAIRSLAVDGKDAGTVVMPQRGVANWNDWGRSFPVTVPLTRGKHSLQLRLDTVDENMNPATNHALVDRIVVKRLR